MPYYKWAWRGLENLERLSELKPLFEQVLSSEGERESVVEEICARLLEELKRQNPDIWGGDVFGIACGKNFGGERRDESDNRTNCRNGVGDVSKCEKYRRACCVSG